MKKLIIFEKLKIDELGQSLAFLHQNEMKIVIVLGERNGSNFDLAMLRVYPF